VRELRILTGDDLAAAQRIRFAAFGSPSDLPAADARFRKTLPCSLGSFEDGKLKSVATMFPFKAFFAGQVVGFGGLAGVATAAEARRRGHVGALLRGWYERLQQQGVAFSGEFPFDPSFYARYGYQTVPRGQLVDLPIRRLQDSVRIEPKVEAVEVDPADLTRLVALHRAFASRFSFALTRESAERDCWAVALKPYWDRDPHFAYLLDDAYVTLKFDRKEQLDKLVVRDLAYVSPAGRHRLLSFLASLEGQVEKVRINLPPGDPLLAQWAPWHAEHDSPFQLRVIDLRSALVPLRSERASEFRLRLVDADCPWNDGLFDIALSPQGSQVVRSPAGAVEAAASLDIRALAALLAHVATPEALLAQGQAEGQAGPLRELARLTERHPSFMMESDHF